MKKVKVEKDPADCEPNVVYFTWDYEDKKVDDIMSNEERNNITILRRKCLMWVEEVKKIANWKEGETLHINTKSNCDGCFRAYWCKEDHPDFRYYEDVVVEPSGYVLMRTFNLYTWDEPRTFNIRVSSVYNDKVCDKLNKKK